MFFGEMLRGMIHVADKNELTIMCFNSDDSKKKDLQTLEILAGHRVRGLIYVPAVSYEEKNERKVLNRYLRTLDAPVVIADRNIDLPVDGVFFDDSAAMYEATREVIEAGHTRICLLYTSNIWEISSVISTHAVDVLKVWMIWAAVKLSAHLCHCPRCLAIPQTSVPGHRDAETTPCSSRATSRYRSLYRKKCYPIKMPKYQKKA